MTEAVIFNSPEHTFKEHYQILYLFTLSLLAYLTKMDILPAEYLRQLKLYKVMSSHLKSTFSHKGISSMILQTVVT